MSNQQYTTDATIPKDKIVVKTVTKEESEALKKKLETKKDKIVRK